MFKGTILGALEPLDGSWQVRDRVGAAIPRSSWVCRVGGFRSKVSLSAIESFEASKHTSHSVSCDIRRKLTVAVGGLPN